MKKQKPADYIVEFKVPSIYIKYKKRKKRKKKNG